MPEGVIIPEIPYPDVRQAADWLCRCFGFSERLRIANHRSQLTLDHGSIVVVFQETGISSHSNMVRVTDINSHFARAQQSGVHILNPPTDYPYGERQYTAIDLAGHRWTFSQTIKDIDPFEWGGELFD